MKFLMVIVLLCFSSSIAVADYLNPTTAADCRNVNIPIYQTKRNWFARGHECNKQFPMTMSRMRDAEPTSCWGRQVSECAEFYQRSCDLTDRLRVVVAACRVKLSDHRLHEQEVREAQEQFERDQRDLVDVDRLAFQEEQNSQMRDQSRFWQDATRNAMNTDNLGPDAIHALNLQSQVKRANLLSIRDPREAAMAALGLRMPRFNAHSVSGQLTKYGTRLVLGAHVSAQQDLNDALSQFSGSLDNNMSRQGGNSFGVGNPRPFASQFDEVYELNDELNAHIDRVVSAIQRLPVEDKSMVNSPAGELLSKIVLARANGEISNLSTAVTELVSLVKADAAQTLTERETTSDVDFNLAAERMAIANLVETEARRLADIAASAARDQQRAANVRSGSTVKNGNASHCFAFEVISESFSIYRNVCNRTVECRPNDRTLNRYRPGDISKTAFDGRSVWVHFCNFQ